MKRNFARATLSNTSLHATTLTTASLLMLMITLSGCEVLPDNSIDYKSAKPGKSLEIPPDLSQLSRETRYQRPAGGVVSAVDANKSNAASNASTLQGGAVAVLSAGDARIERDGNVRWLVVKRPVGQVWAPVRDFWSDMGFLLTMEDAKIGVMETDWAENRAKIPMDFLRTTLGKVFDSLYATAERDKFRVRMEQNTAGETEIYVTHKGMIEEFNKDKTSTVWVPRPVDTNLEAEFLRRIMLRLGSSEAQSNAALTASKSPESNSAANIQAQKSRIVDSDGVRSISLAQPFDRAWRTTGLSLDRLGFTIEDRNRSDGVYFVRYVEGAATEEKKGFLSGLFSKTPDAKPTRYQIKVKSQADQSLVQVLNEKGLADSGAGSKRILDILAGDLR